MRAQICRMRSVRGGDRCNWCRRGSFWGGSQLKGSSLEGRCWGTMTRSCGEEEGGGERDGKRRTIDRQSGFRKG